MATKRTEEYLERQRIAQRKRRAEFPELVREQGRLWARKYRKLHPEEAKRVKTAYDRKHRQEACERRKAWYQQNRDRALGRAKEYRQKNLEKVRERTRRWRKNNPEKVKAWSCNHKDKLREAHLKKKFALTPPEYNLMLAAQGDACALCLGPTSSFSKRLHVDHDHESQRIRGLLCQLCNLAVALFDRDRGLLDSNAFWERLKAYLGATDADVPLFM